MTATGNNLTSPGTVPASTASAEPSATLESLAASVNGIGITLVEYQAELVQFQSARGAQPTPEEKQRVLDNIIDQELLAQAAAEQGFTVDEPTLQQRILQLGKEQDLEAWIRNNGYTQDEFRKVLTRSIAAAWMRDQITSTLPKSTEQVRARQILLYTLAEANQVMEQLQSGSSFENLALKYDPYTAGDLGWFPRDFLPDPQIEQAAFSLQPGEFSGVIQTTAGFHILQVIERAAQRSLEPEAWLVLQSRAVESWLEQHRSQSNIEIFV